MYSVYKAAYNICYFNSLVNDKQAMKKKTRRLFIKQLK